MPRSTNPSMQTTIKSFNSENSNPNLPYFYPEKCREGGMVKNRVEAPSCLPEPMLGQVKDLEKGFDSGLNGKFSGFEEPLRSLDGQRCVYSASSRSRWNKKLKLTSQHPFNLVTEIKRDVETHGDFIRLLIKNVSNGSFTNIGDLIPFVKWLDDELSVLF